MRFLYEHHKNEICGGVHVHVMLERNLGGHIVCHAGLVSIRFPPHWLHRSRSRLGHHNCFRQSVNVHAGFVPASLTARDNRTNAILAHVG